MISPELDVAITKIIGKLPEKVNNLTAIVKNLKNIPSDCQKRKEELLSQSPLMSTIVILTTREEWEEGNNDHEMNSIKPS